MKECDKALDYWGPRIIYCEAMMVELKRAVQLGGSLTNGHNIYPYLEEK